MRPVDPRETMTNYQMLFMTKEGDLLWFDCDELRGRAAATIPNRGIRHFRLERIITDVERQVPSPLTTVIYGIPRYAFFYLEVGSEMSDTSFRRIREALNNL